MSFGTEVRDGLATYEVFRSYIAVFMIVLFVCSGMCGLFYTINAHYVSITGQITNASGGQYINYTVNNKPYSLLLAQQPNVIITNRNVRSCSQGNPIIDSNGYVVDCKQNNFQYVTGNHTVYYQNSNPTSYSLDSNPNMIMGGILGVLCCLLLLSIMWLLFMKSNKNIAAGMGGLSVANTLFSNNNGYSY